MAKLIEKSKDPRISDTLLKKKRLDLVDMEVHTGKQSCQSGFNDGGMREEQLEMGHESMETELRRRWKSKLLRKGKVLLTTHKREIRVQQVECTRQTLEAFRGLCLCMDDLGLGGFLKGKFGTLSQSHQKASKRHVTSSKIISLHPMDKNQHPEYIQTNDREQAFRGKANTCRAPSLISNQRNAKKGQNGTEVLVFSLSGKK